MKILKAEYAQAMRSYTGHYEKISDLVYTYDRQWMHVRFTLQLTPDEEYWLIEDPSFGLREKFNIAFEDALTEYCMNLK